MYTINEKDNFKYLTFPMLEKYNDLFHCFTTRCGGVSTGVYKSLNLGFSTEDEKENIIKNYEILSEKLSIDLNNAVRTFQTHTSNIKYANEKDKGKLFDENTSEDIDGLITDKKNIALITFHADCIPIFFYDSVKKIIGLAHAGWRGTVQNIAGKMIERFINDFNSNPKDIFAVIGPSLGQCCFEVDKDVANLFVSENPVYEKFIITKGKKYHIDLWKVNEYILMQNGIIKENIETAEICTKCNNDLFFSHRGQGGKRGLMIGIIMMK